jgi:hypothetical protein
MAADVSGSHARVQALLCWSASKYYIPSLYWLTSTSKSSRCERLVRISLIRSMSVTNTVCSGLRPIRSSYSRCVGLSACSQGHPQYKRCFTQQLSEPAKLSTSRPYLFSRSVASMSCRSTSIRPLEEENLPGYDPLEFYPVRLGDSIRDRYRVVGKLGYGANSTVWFCRDEQ